MEEAAVQAFRMEERRVGAVVTCWNGALDGRVRVNPHGAQEAIGY